MAVAEQQRLHEPAEGGEHNRLRQQFAHERRNHRAARGAEPLDRRAKLYLIANRVARYEHYHQRQHSRQEAVAEIYRVVHPRVAEQMLVNDYWLQQRSGSLLIDAKRCQRRHRHAAGRRYRRGLEPLENERAGNIHRQVGVERYRGSPAIQRVFLEVARNLEESENLAVANLRHCVVETLLGIFQINQLRRRQIARNSARKRRMVEVDNRRRDPQRQPFRHQIEEEEVAEQRDEQRGANK